MKNYLHRNNSEIEPPEILHGKISEATEYIKRTYKLETGKDYSVKVGLILGSGLGPAAEKIENPVIIPYQDIPHFPPSTVVGHAGRLILGDIHGVSVAAMQGRIHFYEGYFDWQIALPARILLALGIEALIPTNAAGSVNPDFHPGDIMLIEDHINNLGRNPLVGSHHSDWGERFVDMSDAYSLKFRKIMFEAAEELKLDLKKGVYVANMGPSYETAAEGKMLRLLGADVIGMSTVPEVITARQQKVPVAAISLISNFVTGMTTDDVNHKEVMEIAAKSGEKIQKLIYLFIKKVFA